MKKEIRPSLPEGCNPTRSVPPNHVWQAIDCPREMRNECLQYMRKLNDFFVASHRIDEKWPNFCCEDCPHGDKYRFPHQARGVVKKAEKTAKKPQSEKILSSQAGEAAPESGSGK
ncbi:MAG: hypothetical protein ACOYS2_02050 [Patescibacteria group bacterium]